MAPLPVSPELEFVLDMDTERRSRGQAPRGSFLGRGPADPEHQLSGTLELPQQHSRACVTPTFQLHDGIRDKLRPIVVTLAYGIRGPEGRRGGRGAVLPPLSPAL
ncbi:ITA7 protein, partial [Piprites chloris]|nr:ITA7 protein [Piprites chloris]